MTSHHRATQAVELSIKAKLFLFGVPGFRKALRMYHAIVDTHLCPKRNLRWKKIDSAQWGVGATLKSSFLHFATCGNASYNLHVLKDDTTIELGPRLAAYVSYRRVTRAWIAFLNGHPSERVDFGTIGRDTFRGDEW